MSGRFDDAEFEAVVSRLKSERAEMTPLEMDAMKRRVMRRATPRRGAILVKSRFTTLLTVLSLVGGTGGAIAVAANSGGGGGNSSAQAQYSGNGKKCGIPGASDPSCPPTSNGGGQSSSAGKPSSNGKHGKSSQHTTSSATTVSDLQSNLDIDKSELASSQKSSTPNYTSVKQTLANIVQDIAAANALGDSADRASLTALAQKALTQLNALDAKTLNSILDGASTNSSAVLTQIGNDFKSAIALHDYRTAAELALGQLFLENSLGQIRLASDATDTIAKAIVRSAQSRNGRVAQELRSLRSVNAKALAQAKSSGNWYGVDELTLEDQVINALLTKKSSANTKAMKAIERHIVRKMQLAQQHKNTLAYNKLRLEKALLLAKIRHDS